MNDTAHRGRWRRNGQMRRQKITQIATTTGSNESTGTTRASTWEANESYRMSKTNLMVERGEIHPNAMFCGDGKFIIGRVEAVRF